MKILEFFDPLCRNIPSISHKSRKLKIYVRSGEELNPHDCFSYLQWAKTKLMGSGFLLMLTQWVDFLTDKDIPYIEKWPTAWACIHELNIWIITTILVIALDLTLKPIVSITTVTSELNLHKGCRIGVSWSNIAVPVNGLKRLERS